MIYRARWVLPIARPPIRDGWVRVEGGRIIALGGSPPRGVPRRGTSDAAASQCVADESRARVVDLGSVALLPGLVNAHTHLELSWLRNRVAPAPGLPAWVRSVLSERRGAETGPEEACAIERAIFEAVAAGTAVVGDVGNTLASVGPLARSPLTSVVFHELIRFDPENASELVEEALETIRGLPRAEHVRVALAAHAPYSVSASLFKAVRGASRREGTPCSVHLAESAEELDLLARGNGPWRALLEELGAWAPGWTAPACGPVEYLDGLGFLDEGVLVAHGVQLTDEELGCLAARRSTLVTCPRSNAWTGVGSPPVERFYRSGVPVAVGTDSLASAPDLNLFAELAELRRLAPAVPASALLESATRQGARALGVDAELGTIEAGKRARLIAVTLPGRTGDVEEDLLGGITPDRVRWVGGEDVSAPLSTE